MRLANYDGRAFILVGDDAGIDVHEASDGAFGPDCPSVYEDWEEFRAWGDGAELTTPAHVIDPQLLGPPSPRPRQIFAVGLNYSDHARESGFQKPSNFPPIFPKFSSALAGAKSTVVLPDGGQTDWEVELVVIIGAEARHVPAERAWEHIAGLTVGQDISERITQLEGEVPQFGLGKSFPGFAPIGPWLVTPDVFENPDDLKLGCSIDGEEVQLSRTVNLIFSVPELIAGLSRRLTLFPGDIIFTGTPEGVGLGMQPQRYLSEGETLVSYIEGIGEISQTFVSGCGVN